MPRCPTLVIAGTHSGSGKTSLTLALTRALVRRGLRVQTFKTGPDFLDPTYLALASGRPCYNLDGWMTGREYVRRLFERTARDADIALIEGVMGLFDGADASTNEGSTAEIALWLDAPVLLVANVHGMGRSIAALVKGFTTFDTALRFAGIVANHCGSDRHAAWLGDSLKAAGLTPLAGAIPRGAFPKLASRHLGLITADREQLSEALLDTLAETLERHITLETLFPLNLTGRMDVPDLPSPAHKEKLKIGVARDAAFHFYYQDLFDALTAAGCNICFFSPLSDRQLPEGISGLYIGGGYPEAHAKTLATNSEMLDSIRHYATSGKPLYAECGGLMYLSEGLQAGSDFYPFLGILPTRTRMLTAKKRLGYVEITLTAKSLWGESGDLFRGHEFHYSELIDNPTADPSWQTVYDVRRRRSERIEAEGFQKGAILASYTHLVYAACPAAVPHFLNQCGDSP